MLELSHDYSLKDGENHESARVYLHCSAIKNINWPVLSQSQRSNFLSHVITEKNLSLLASFKRSSQFLIRWRVARVTAQ